MSVFRLDFFKLQYLKERGDFEFEKVGGFGLEIFRTRNRPTFSNPNILKSEAILSLKKWAALGSKFFEPETAQLFPTQIF